VIGVDLHAFVGKEAVADVLLPHAGQVHAGVLSVQVVTVPVAGRDVTSAGLIALVVIFLPLDMGVLKLVPTVGAAVLALEEEE